MNMRPTGRAQLPRMIEGGVSSLHLPRTRKVIQSVRWTIERSMFLASFFPSVKRQPVEILAQATSPSRVRLTGPQDWFVTDMKYCWPIAGNAPVISRAVKQKLGVIFI